MPDPKRTSPVIGLCGKPENLKTGAEKQVYQLHIKPNVVLQK